MSGQLHHLELERLDESCVDFEISRADFVDSSTHEKAGFSSDASVCWSTVGTTIMFFNVSDGCLLCQWAFKQIKNQAVNEITAIAEYNSCTTSNSFYLIALETGSGNFLVVFTLDDMLKIVSTIKLVAKCVNIECFNNNVNFQPTEFCSFGGFAVLGFDPVQVIVLDLNESTFQIELSHFPQDILNLKYIDCRLVTDNTLNKDENLCVKLDPCYCDGKVFNYCDTDGSVIKAIKKSVCVTNLKYFSALDVLAIGFDIAGFQLWSLTGPEMMFASEFVEDVPKRVAFFEFQAPEDDPRRCLYLWVAYSNITSKSKTPHTHVHGAGCSDHFASLIMYQLNFDDTEEILLRTCRPWFRVNLTSDVFLNNFDSFNESKVLSMGICSAANSKPGISSQIYFCWQFENSHITDEEECVGTEVQVGLFDLNCWYEAQMPQSVRLLTDQSFCPYFSVYNCSQNLFYPQESVSAFTLLPCSLSPFEFADVPPPVCSSWICSYSIRGAFLSDKGIVACKGDAIQKRVLEQCEELAEIEQFDQNNISDLNRGIIIAKLIDPTELNSLLYDSSLHNLNCLNSTSVSAGELQNILKTLLVYSDHNCLLQIFTMIKNLELIGPEMNLPSSFFDAVQGLRLHLANLIKSFDKFSLSFFNYEVPELNKTFNDKFLKMFQQLKLYASFFRLFCDTFVTDQDSSPVTLEEYLAIVNVVDYYNVVEWLSESCFLPEINPEMIPENDGVVENGFSFPAFEMDELYEQCKGLYSIKGQNNCLLYHYLLDCFAIELNYPCRGFHEILTNIFRNPKCSQPFDVKLAVFNYIFLDIAAVLCPENKFEEITVLPNLQNKNWLHCVKALWYIDHGFSEMAATYIYTCDLSVLPSNLLSSMIARLIGANSSDVAFHVLRTYSWYPVDDFARKMAVSVCLSANKILLASEMISGFEDESVIDYFFEEIENLSLLPELLRVNWQSFNPAIVDFIKRNDGHRFGYLCVLKEALSNSHDRVFDKGKVAYSYPAAGPDPVANIWQLMKDLQNPEEERGRPLFESSVVPENAANAQDLNFSLSKPLVTTVLRNTAKYKTILNQSIVQPKVSKFDKFVTQTFNQSSTSIRSSKTLSHKVRVSSGTDKEVFQLNSPAAVHLLSTPEVQLRSRAAGNCDSLGNGFRSILKDSTDFETSNYGSPLLERIALNMKPEFACVDSPGMSPFKRTFPKTPMPRGRLTFFANSKNKNATQDGFIREQGTSVSIKKKGAIVVDDEISFTKHEESASSTEAHNATVVMTEEEPRLILREAESYPDFNAIPNRRVVNCFIDDQDNLPPSNATAEEEENFEFEVPTARVPNSEPSKLRNEDEKEKSIDEMFRFSYPYLKTQSCDSRLNSSTVPYWEAFPKKGHGDRRQVTFFEP